MAAKLEWDGAQLRLGVWTIAETRMAVMGYAWRRVGGEWSAGYMDLEDAEQDAESEVRRLLKEAGVTIE